MSKVKEYSSMTKDKLMLYTFVALLIIAIVSVVLWSQANPINPLNPEEQLMNLGLTAAIICVIAVGVAVGTDALLHKVAADSPLNTMSAAVFGLIVALSYSLGVPNMGIGAEAIAFTSAPSAFVYVALISLIGLVLFKKLQGLAGRKFVNPAAAAKLLALLPFVSTVLFAKEHFADFASGGLSVPLLSGPIGRTVIGNNGLILNGDNVSGSFASYLQNCYGLQTAAASTDLNRIMIFEKFHGWVGGASSIAVIIVGIALFVLARRYIKWRITLSYFVAIALMAFLLTAVYGGDLDVRLLFSIFIGSSIFLGFFMATDPATTPLTYTGQLIFGAGLGVLTVLIQTYMNFFGGSILALVIMNLTSPFLDKVGKRSPTTEKKEPKLPKAKQFAIVKTTECIRCGACMRVCCHKLSPILIKEAFDKTNVEKLAKLRADLCEGCGHCSFICPARIDLKGSILRSKALLRNK